MNFFSRQFNYNNKQAKQFYTQVNCFKSTWSANSISINNRPTVRTASQRLTYCFRCGHKEKRESHLRDLVVKRALKARSTQNDRVKRHTTQLFTSFFQAATPFISLKRRRQRRGKQTISKLFPLDRARSERKSYGAFAARLYTSGRASKPFVYRLESELESLSSVAGSRNATSGGVSSTVREKRDQVHRTAFQSRPYHWKEVTRGENTENVLI